MMKIAIIGGGAIGLLFSHYLSQKHEIILYVRNENQRNIINSSGITVQNKNHLSKTKVRVELVAEWGLNGEELSIICVKQYQLQQLLETANISRDHSLLFLQNGMGHLKWIDHYGLENVLVGSVEHGVYRKKENSVVHTGDGCTKIAHYKGDVNGISLELSKQFHDTFPFVIEDDFQEMLQKKLVVNAIINPLTSILKVQNGVLLENSYYFQVFNELFTEIKGILNIQEEQLYYENVIEVCRKTGKNRSSMLKDIEEHRPTEVDAILGYLIEEAEKKGVQAPLINTLFRLIKGSEIKGGGELDVRNLF